VFLTPLIRELVGRGYDVHLLTSPACGGREPDFPDLPGCTVHRVPMPRGISPVADLLAVGRLWRFFRRERFAAVQAHMSKCASLVLPAAWMAGVPLRLYTNHGMAFLSAHGLRRRLLRGIEAMSCRLVHGVYFVSFSNREAAVAEGMVPLGKAAVVGQGSICGIDAERFAPTPERRAAGRALRERLGIAPEAFVVGHVGRAVAHKGYGVSVGTWRRFFADVAGCHLLLVGSAVADFERVYGRRPPGNVSVVEWTDEMAGCYAAMDVVVMPSLHEGLGYTLLEAGAAGLPVVGSRIPGVMDAIEERVNGLLVAPGDEAALAGALRELWAGPELRRSLGTAGAARVRARYDQGQVCRAFGDEWDRRMAEVGRA
jgi:glycosyltransferase involved in cell wall biosynthesis